MTRNNHANSLPKVAADMETTVDFHTTKVQGAALMLHLAHLGAVVEEAILVLLEVILEDLVAIQVHLVVRQILDLDHLRLVRHDDR